ncbi:hypothetical protein [Halobacterium sp. CBA1126]|uniref:hypothetical protein n=1 Tax=Halobacterium sp. CBA1126 TaxID=2668074 RepID=UPI0012F72A4F|nr:hypothetical protein [Halobacterium sp. CBA1126]MUV60214.1 hypothetical protein [Halobacterium sp. CBA1126]
MLPLVEVTDEDDLNALRAYREVGEAVMIELPRYLSEQENKYQEPVSELIENYGSIAEFYQRKVDSKYVPVVSGSNSPVDYSEHLSMYRDLREDFNRLAVRLILRRPSELLTGLQRDTLEELGTEVRHEDILLFDIGDNSITDPLLEDLEYLSEVFETPTTAVLNAFDAYNERPNNQSPHLAEDIGASAFGDFGINKRFKPNPDDGFVPPSVKHRHYVPNQSTVEVFKGDTFEEAAESLSDWSEWDASHCEGCHRAASTNNYDVNTWVQIRMEHYFRSILRDEI